MALTNAERQKQYRERLRVQNPDKLAQLNKKNSERNKKRKKVQDCSKEEKALKRKQWKESQNRHRMKAKKSENIENHENIDPDEDVSPKIDTKRSLYTEKKRSLRKLAYVREKYEQKIKSMATEMRNLKKKCKRYMQKNKKLLALVHDFKLKAEQLEINKNENEMTPLSKSNSFIEQNLPNIPEQEKEKVKRHLLTHNVLVTAIQDTYGETKKNEDRNVLKKILQNKAIRKYKKQSEITKSVFGLKGWARQRKTLTRKNSIIINEIVQFYNRDDVSRATAGKKEFKTEGKIKKQRRYLLNTLKELYKKYRAEGGRAKRTSFIKYKPLYVMQPKLSDRETCGCIKHENFSIIIKKLNSLGMIETTDLDEFLSEVVCNLDSRECAYGECSACNNKCIKLSWDHLDVNEIVTWNGFAMDRIEYINKKDGKKVSTKKMVKKEIHGTLKSLTESLSEKLKLMKKHSFNIKHQYSQYLKCIQNLMPTEVAIHIDFSENYVCKLATEVQSMHFGASKSQITIHTGVLYVKEKAPQSFASLSPSNEHGPEAIWAHLKPILNHVRREYPLVNAVHYFSDGPATQYKQKKNFYLFTKSMEDLGFRHSTWNFSESSHGKGAADGVGGGLKRRLDNYVKHGIDIPDASTAYTHLKNSDTTVMTFFIPEVEIAEYAVEENLIPVPQTMNLHQITKTETPNVIRYRCLSCFCGDSHRGYCDCFDAKIHQLVKTVNQKDKNNTEKSHLKRKINGDGDDTTKVRNGKKRAKVTVLSDVKYRPENKAYENLQECGLLKLKGLQKIDSDFNLCSANKENINYDNSKPSTSGTSKKQSNQTIAKKMRPNRLSINSDDSSTHEDDEYSLHDSSDDDYYEEPVSSTEEGMEENTAEITDIETYNKTKEETHKYNEISEGIEANIKKTKEIELYNETNGDTHRNNIETAAASGVEETNEETVQTGINNKNKEETYMNNNYSTEGMQVNNEETREIEIYSETKEETNLNDYKTTEGIDDTIKEITKIEICIKKTKEDAQRDDNETTAGLKKDNKENTDTETYNETKEDKYMTDKEIAEGTQQNNKKTMSTDLYNKTIVTHNINGHECAESIKEKNKETIDIEIHNKAKEQYKINDSVIVRYFIKNRWKYFIGFIQDIASKNNDIFYTIIYLKTNKKPGLTFIKTKKVDQDVVPAICVIKKVKLAYDGKKYVLENEDENIYF